MSSSESIWPQLFNNSNCSINRAKFLGYLTALGKSLFILRKSYENNNCAIIINYTVFYIVAFYIVCPQSHGSLLTDYRKPTKQNEHFLSSPNNNNNFLSSYEPVHRISLNRYNTWNVFLLFGKDFSYFVDFLLQVKSAP